MATFETYSIVEQAGTLSSTAINKAKSLKEEIKKEREELKRVEEAYNQYMHEDLNGAERDAREDRNNTIRERNKGRTTTKSEEEITKGEGSKQSILKEKRHTYSEERKTEKQRKALQISKAAGYKIDIEETAAKGNHKRVQDFPSQPTLSVGTDVWTPESGNGVGIEYLDKTKEIESRVPLKEKETPTTGNTDTNINEEGTHNTAPPEEETNTLQNNEQVTEAAQTVTPQRTYWGDKFDKESLSDGIIDELVYEREKELKADAYIENHPLIPQLKTMQQEVESACKVETPDPDLVEQRQENSLKHTTILTLWFVRFAILVIMLAEYKEFAYIADLVYRMDWLTSILFTLGLIGAVKGVATVWQKDVSFWVRTHEHSPLTKIIDRFKIAITIGASVFMLCMGILVISNIDYKNMVKKESKYKRLLAKVYEDESKYTEDVFEQKVTETTQALERAQERVRKWEDEPSWYYTLAKYLSIPFYGLILFFLSAFLTAYESVIYRAVKYQSQIRKLEKRIAKNSARLQKVNDLYNEGVNTIYITLREIGIKEYCEKMVLTTE